MTLTNYDYTVGWISALPLEMAPVKAMMDALHPPLKQVVQDTNNYTLGRIGIHNVVLVCLPSMGTNSAAHAAANLLRSFPNVRCGLMVGIGGGVPSSPKSDPNSTRDIRLGDVVVGSPSDLHGGIIQYDFGSITQEGDTMNFKRKGTLNKPPSLLLGALRSIQADNMMGSTSFYRHYDQMLEKYPTMITEYHRPEMDRLYKAEYIHNGNRPDCSQCSAEQLVERQFRDVAVVHYGLIGSANQVLRNAMLRDRLHATERIICFEMEAAGLMDEFPCIIIRGISDYCDSHKSKQWQPYSSAIAAACGKELLLKVLPITVEESPHIERLAILPNHNVNGEPGPTGITGLHAIQDITQDFDSLEKHKKCLDDLNCAHPRFDKLRLEDLKGGLLRDAYKWILNTKEYTTWFSNREILWIRGDPGKGKTMLMCGIIDEMMDGKIAYFFCQATVDTKRTATQVLQGLIFVILEDTPSLCDKVCGRIERASELPEESAFYVLREVLEDLLSSCEMTLMVDALDECSIGLDRLLRFIASTSASHNCRWLVTSRNNPEIVEVLQETSQLSLELNETSVNEAVNIYIAYKVSILTRVKKYDEVLQTFILSYLMGNAQGTFLWVSLVSLNLAAQRLHQTKKVLLEYPPGLEPLYARMLDHLGASNDAHKLKQILAIACTVFRPVTLEELGTLIAVNDEDHNVAWIEDMVRDCGSFLTLRSSIVQFVHQSAKDFLLLRETEGIFPDSDLAIHQIIFSGSLQSLRDLSRNMYGLKEPGVSVDAIDVPVPDPLAKMRYAAVYWIEHLFQVLDPLSTGIIDPRDIDLVSHFFETKYLYWLEAISLLRNVYPCLLAITKLTSRLDVSVSGLNSTPKHPGMVKVLHLMTDALQCLRYFQYALIRYPFQVYVSVTLFSPMQSLIRQHFSHEIPRWATIQRGPLDLWPMTLSLDLGSARIIEFSPSGEWLATVDGNRCVRIWETASGQLLNEIMPLGVEALMFARDGTSFMLFDDEENLIQSYPILNSQVLNTVLLEGQSEIRHSVTCAAFSHNSAFLFISKYRKQIIYVHSTETGNLVKTLSCEQYLDRMIFSPCDTYFAGVDQHSVYIWDTQASRIVWQTLEDEEEDVRLAFSPCSKLLAIGGTTFKLWRWRDDQRLYTLEKSSQYLHMVFHPKQPSIFVCNGSSIEEWRSDKPIKLRTCGSLGRPILIIAISGDGKSLIASDLNTVKIWRAETPLSGIEKAMVSGSSFEDLRLIDSNIYGIARGKSSTEIRLWTDIMQGTPNLVTRLEFRAFQWQISPSCSKAVFRATYSELIEIWDLNRARRIGTLRVVESQNNLNPLSIAWCISDTEFTICDPGSSSVRVYQIQDDDIAEGVSFPFMVSYPMCIRWSNQGILFAMVHSEGLCVWDKRSQEWIDYHKTENYCWWAMAHGDLQFSPDGSLLSVLAGREDLHVFRTDTGTMVLSVPYDTGWRAPFTRKGFQFEGNTFSLSIDEKWLKTDKAYYTASEGFLAPEVQVESHPSVHLNMEVDARVDRPWIRCGNDNIIWLPQDFRPTMNSWDIVDSTIVMIAFNGSLVILDVTWDPTKDFSSQAPSPKSKPSNKRRRSSC